MMTNIKVFKIISIVFLLSISFGVFAQTIPEIKKSSLIETIDSTTYYLHFVKDGESVFAIAKAYGVSVNDIFKDNPESRSGVRAGQIIKIVYEQKETIKKKESVQQKDEDFFYHIVKNKETLYGISRGYRVDIEDVEKINPGLDENLKEGQMIKIPALKNPGIGYFDEESDDTKLHTIAQGETLYGIAKEYNVSIGEIKNANPGLTENLAVGSSILIPNQIDDETENTLNSEVEVVDSSKYHKVVAGETLYRIAKNYAVSVDTLKKYNKGLNDALYIGQEILIPAAIDTNNYIVHVPHEKEKLNKIARKYDVSLEKIQMLNPDIKKKVHSGQMVKIPVQARIIEKPEDDLADQDIDPFADNPCANVEIDKDAVYNIALMIPLFLEELDSLLIKDRVDISEQKDLLSFRFIQFYEGMLMAIDSMKNAGMNLNLFVYDVDNTPEKINKVLQASELGSMDLIIGPFYSTGFKQVAKFAETFNIKIVNPLTYREEIIVNQPNVFKVRPPYSTQADQLVDYILEKYPLHHIMLVRHYKYKYQSEVSYIKNRLNSERKKGVFVSNKSLYDAIKLGEENNVANVYSENVLLDKEFIKAHIDDSTWFSNTAKEILYSSDSIRGLSRNVSKARPNLVIALSNQRVFQYDLLSQFNKLAEDNSISLVGIPKWDELEKQEVEHLINLRFQYFSPSFIDYSDELNQAWIQKFRDTYFTEPSETKYAFDGFDIGWYFLNALYTYGRDFENCIPEFQIHLIQTRFDFEQNLPNGFQNTHWNLLKYDGYKVVNEKL